MHFRLFSDNANAINAAPLSLFHKTLRIARNSVTRANAKIRETTN